MRLGLTFVVALAACSSAPSVGPRSTFTDDQALAARQACQFGPGDLPGLSAAKNAKLGSEIPIDTIVIIMMENRSFDHLLGDLASTQSDADVAAPDATNPDTDGTPIPRFHMSDYCFDDPNHGWNEVHLEWDQGKMDGFVVENYQNNGAPADGHRAMGYYTADDAPIIYSLANTFAVADKYFCSLLGPTFPNRAFMAGGSAFGYPDGNLFTDPHNNIMEIMTTGKVTWHDYYQSLPTLGIYLDSLSKYIGNISVGDVFFNDAKTGNLSQVNWVDPQLGDNFGAIRTDLHPPGDVQVGDQWVGTILTALMDSPQWPHMAVFFTFDEHGGLYDHVPPPAACPPDDLAPMLGPNDQPGAFDRLGVRVPFILMSPYAKPHYVSHAVFDHTSMLRFIESRFVLPAMTKRDANADPLFDLFDFDHPPKLLHPPMLPMEVIDQAKYDACNAKYPMPNLNPSPSP
jgi:phospholipase C